MKLSTLLIGTFIVGLLVAPAFAQTPNTAPNLASAPANAPAKPSSADRNFAMKAGAAGLAEVADAQVAELKSDRKDVKDFAIRMVSDHTQANDRLKQIAGSEGINLPAAPNGADQKANQKLSGENGAQFDRDYIVGQRKAHKDAVALFTKESKSGADPQLKAFAAQTLPTLRDHLKMITQMPLSAKSS